MGLFVFLFLFIGMKADASILSDALLQIQNLKNEIIQLKSSLRASVLDASVGITSTTDLTPRISFWSGKVNQHVDVASSTWQTDPTGNFGANEDKLSYCKRFYPDTKSVVDYKLETINSWHDLGNLNNYTSTKMSYKCVPPVVSGLPDLVISDFSWTPVNPVVTNPIGYLYFSVTVKNIGTGEITLPQDMHLTLYKNDIGVGGFALGTAIYNLKPGDTQVFTFKTAQSPNILDTAGSYNLIMKVDSDYYSISTNNGGLVKESNEDNNLFKKAIVISGVSAPITPTTDLTPRISYWQGKVNQHVSVNEKMWQTDADGVSGVEVDMLTYCKKWYPNTTSVVAYKTETINAWHDKGNINNYSSTRMSYKCVVSDKVLFACSDKIDNDNDGKIDENDGMCHLDSDMLKDYIPTHNSETTFPTNSKSPSLKVLYPKGGEIFKAGDKIIVKWESKNVVANDVGIMLVDSNDLTTATTIVYNTPNDGVETIILPKVSGKNFKIFITNDQTGGAYSNSFNISLSEISSEILPSTFEIKLNGDYTSSGASRNYDAHLIFSNGLLVGGSENYSVGEGGVCRVNCNRKDSCIIKNKNWVDAAGGSECKI